MDMRTHTHTKDISEAFFSNGPFLLLVAPLVGVSVWFGAKHRPFSEKKKQTQEGHLCLSVISSGCFLDV